MSQRSRSTGKVETSGYNSMFKPGNHLGLIKIFPKSTEDSRSEFNNHQSINMKRKMTIERSKKMSDESVKEIECAIETPKNIKDI